MNPETIPTSNEAINESAPIATHNEANVNSGFVTIKNFNELKDICILTMMKPSFNAPIDHPVVKPVQQFE